jgi:hypothetical protein
MTAQFAKAGRGRARATGGKWLLERAEIRQRLLRRPLFVQNNLLKIAVDAPAKPTESVPRTSRVTIRVFRVEHF